MKKRLRKLHLNRETLRYLSLELGDVAGGITATCPETATCADTCPRSCNGTCPICTGAQC